jgi:hypothetical protein
VSCYLVQETDGVSRFTLENGTGFLVLDGCVPTPSGGPPIGGSDRKRRRRLGPDSEEEWLVVVLREL